MKKIKLNKISIISLIFAILVVILLMINAITGNRIISGMYYVITGKQLEETGTTIECMVYNNSYNQNIKVLVGITNDYGIEYIVKPDNSKINGSGKTRVFLDYSFVIDEENTFTVKAIGKEPEEKKITITQKTINDQFKMPTSTNTVEEIIYPLKQENKDKVYFRYNNNESWIEYEDKTKLGLLYFERPNLANNEELNTKKIYFYKRDKNNNVVYFDKTVYTKSKPIGELQEGDCVNYNGRKYIILYQYKNHATTYTPQKGYAEDYGSRGVQIILKEGTYSTDAMTINDDTFSNAVQQYNSIVKDLNDHAAIYVKQGDTGVEYRNVGSNPLNPLNRRQ